MLKILNLRLFDGAGTGASAGGNAGTGSSTGANEGGTSDTTSGGTDRKAEFESFKAKYKPELDEFTQGVVKQRLKEHGRLKEANAGMSGIVSDLAIRYGLDSSDYEGIRKALGSDNSYYRDKAMEEGLTEDQYKTQQEAKYKSARYDAMMSEKANRERFEQQLESWKAESESVKEYYPDFDFSKEIGNKDYMDLLLKGINPKTAYEVIHNEEIISGSMAMAARQSRQQAIDNIRSRGVRASEGAIGSQPASHQATDVKNLTKAQREELIRQAQKGATITLKS
jgi:hypothetical protein